jgi:hypothetical protein
MVDKVVQLKTPELDRDPHVTLATLDGNVHVVPVIVLGEVRRRRAR